MKNESLGSKDKGLFDDLVKKITDAHAEEVAEILLKEMKKPRRKCHILTGKDNG